ncbi:MAG TPA: FG-GAP-like repeat-containing protein [Thermoanaerobaculia bacterium]|nr:FG-GAP-like repeat-containing protein [Thermoanaerobaculia bacterium]
MSYRVRSIATSLILLIAGFLMVAPASAAGLIVDAGAPNGSDDTATLQGILDAGDIVSLRPGQTYRLSEKLNITQNNSGIITTGTPAVLYLEDTFNNVEPLQMWDAGRDDSIAIRAEGSLGAPLKSIRLENFKIEKQHLDGTYVTAIWFRGVNNSKILDLDITGFALGAIVALDSVNNVSIRGCSIHDSWATYVNSYAKFPQLTGIVVDDNKLSNNGQAVGSTRVTIAKNTISRLRFGSNLYNLQRGQFQGMSGTNPVGYQTDGITVVPGGSGTVIVGNVIENAGEGIDCMAQDAVIRTNKIRDIFDWGVKFVHGAKNGLVEDNDIGAAGTGSIVVSGTTEASYGHTFGHLIRNNRITKVGGLNAFCGSAVPAPYRIFSTCPTTPAASAFTVIPNGGVGWPRYNLFSGNTVTAVSTDVRMKNLIRVDTPAEHSLFFGNSFSNQTGRTIGNQIQAGVVGTIIDPSAIRVVLADFNGDDRDDWFVDWIASGQNYLYRQNSNGTFTRFDNPINPSGINGSPDNLLSGDFNKDGYADVLFHWNTGTNRMYLSDGLGSFDEVLDPMSVSNVGGDPDDALTGDFNGDGYTDVFFFWRQPGTNRFYYGGAGGVFSERLNPINVAAINETPNKVLVGNFDGDAKSDLLFFWGDGRNRFFYGTGTGSFANVDDPILASEINGSPQTVITLDANRDGRDDVLFWWPGSSELRRMYLGRGNRTFLRD